MLSTPSASAPFHAARMASTDVCCGRMCTPTLNPAIGGKLCRRRDGSYRVDLPIGMRIMLLSVLLAQFVALSGCAAPVATPAPQPTTAVVQATPPLTQPTPVA